MAQHSVWIDTEELDGDETLAFQAVCSDCSWSSVWYHTDSFVGDNAEGYAQAEAEADAAEHNRNIGW